MQRLVLFCTGLVVFVAGLILFPLPIPLGLPLILVGLSLLVSSSLYVRRLLQRLRLHYPVMCARLEQVKPHMPLFIRRMIDRTHPDAHDIHEDPPKLP